MGNLSLKSTHSKDYQNLLNNVVDNEVSTIPSNNKALWVAMGYELEIEGVDKLQISTIVRKDIEDKLWETEFKDQISREDYRYNNSHYFRVMKSNGWTNPYMARNTSNDSNDNVDPLGDQKIVPHNNHEMIALCYDLINLSRILIEKSKNGTPFEETFGEKHMNEFYKQMHTVVNNCKNAIDNKTKVPRNTEVFLIECLSTIIKSINKCAEIFMEQNLIRLKKQLTKSIRTGKPVPFFTLKQATKFLKGGKQSQQLILKPLTRDMALFLDYAGVQCECGSWRVRPKPESHNCECYDCDKVLPPAHISKCEHCSVPLYKERLTYMINHKNKCQNCNEVVDLPQVLVEYAKS